MLFLGLVLGVVLGYWISLIVRSLMAMAIDCGAYPKYSVFKEKVVKPEYRESFKRKEWLRLVLGGYV